MALGGSLTRPMLLLLLISLLLAGVQKSSTTDAEDYLDRCCDQGERWAGQKLRCERFSGEVLGVPREEQAACQEAFDICCRRTFQEADCELGKADAKAGRVCRTMLLDDGDTDAAGKSTSVLGIGNFKHECCEACKLGILTGSSGKGCAPRKFSLGAPRDPAFRECCDEAKSSNTTNIASTSTMTLLSTETEEELDFDNDEHFSTNTVSDTRYDDLCKLLKGLLCSEICVPTPGSFYCKCQEGSILQVDGRTCKSNVTTTAQSPTISSTTPSTTKSKPTTTIVTTKSEPITSSTKSPTTAKYRKKAVAWKKKEKAFSPASTLKQLLQGAKLRTTRSSPSTEDNELSSPCPSGYRFAAANGSCEDIDECAENSHNCGNEKCYNLPGRFHCAKALVPVIRKKITTATTTTTSEAIKILDDGNKCDPGFKFNAFRHECIDINECTELEDACSSNEDCLNNPGSFTCTCRVGFRRESLTGACVDINECQLKNHCLASQRCDNTIGSYVCVRFLSCGTGYTLNAATEICEDDDECLLGTHDCARGYHCRNTLGSFRCDKDQIRPTPAVSRFKTPRPTLKTTLLAYTTARSVSTAAPVTSPKPEITNPLKISTTIKPNVTSTSKPMTTVKSVVDNTSKPKVATTSKPKIMTTIKPKFTLKPMPHIPATTKSPNLTITTTEEIPTVGTVPGITQKPKTSPITTLRPRTCPRGFETGPLGQCIDIDECHRNLKMCGNQRCVNTLGSFRCEPKTLCSIGYAPDRLSGICKDIDECAQGTHKCGPNQTCENRPGGYVCYCPPGYEVGGGHECVDIDECSRVAGLCGSGGHCVNTPGSYSCACEPGFENELGSLGCRDVDECRSQPAVCQQECYNTWGGHRCGCRFGYRLRPDNRTCEDVDECTEFRENNLCIGICENTPGSYSCSCPDGYKLAEDARTCIDIDECVTGNVCKTAGDLCMNLRGGFRCNRIVCPAGYIRDPNKMNRCIRENPYCPVHDQACFQRPAHYTYNYIGMVSMYPIPATTGQVELFTMRGTYTLPGSSVRFSMALIGARAPPRIQPATESCFALRQPFASQAVLVMTKSLQGPQDIELEFSMEIYGPTGTLAGSAIAKIFIIVTQYEF